MLVDLYHGVADGEGYDHLTNIEKVEGTDDRDTFIAASDSTFFDGRDGRDSMNYGHATTGVSAANAWDGVDLRYEATVTGWGTATLHNMEVFIGGAGNDSITGFQRMSGGLGDDTFGVSEGWESVDYVHSETGVNVVMDFYGDVGGGVYHGKATGEGVDSLEGVRSVYGSDNDDTISGTGGDDYLMGRLGNDVLDGTGGQDQAYYWFSDSGVYVDLDEGIAAGQGFSHTLANIEHVGGSDYDDTIVGDGGNNGINGQWGSDLLIGGDGVDTLNFMEATYVDLGACRAVDAHGVDSVFGFEAVLGSPNGADTIIGADGMDEFLSGQGGDDSISGNGGNDTLDGGDGFDTLLGGDGDDSLSGGNGYDKLYGGDGADWLSGGEGMNTLSGGFGDDTLAGTATATDWADYSFFSPSSGTTGVVANVSGAASAEGVTHSLSYINGLIGSGFDDTLTASMVDGGAGSDSLVASAVEFRTSAQSVNVQMANMMAISGSDVDTLVGTTSVTGSEFADTMTAVDGMGICFYGESGDDSLTGADQADHLEGGLGDDEVFGLAGDDVLEGAGGADTLDGGDGNDTLNASADNMADDYDGNTGTDMLSYATAGGQTGRSGISLTLADGAFATVTDFIGVGADRVKAVEHVVGTSADDTIIGATGAVTLDGYMGDDSLVGGAGGDSLVGGLGDDTLAGGLGSDELVGGDGMDELSGEAGNDTLYATADGEDDWFSGGDDVDELSFEQLGGSTGQQGVVLDLADSGWSTATSSSFALGEDQVSAVEQVVGSGADDTLAGTVSADTLSGGGGDDSLSGEDGADVLDGGAGDDELLDGAGDDVLYGGDGADTLYGTGGVDMLYGGDGDDSLSAATDSEGDSLCGGAGADTLVGLAASTVQWADYSDISGTAQAGFQGVVADVANQTATDPWGDTDTYQNIFNVRGTQFNDSLAGSTQDQHLVGLDGDDTLYGGDGIDTLEGGSGADCYYFEGTDEFDAEQIAFLGTEGDTFMLSSAFNGLDANDDGILDDFRFDVRSNYTGSGGANITGFAVIYDDVNDLLIYDDNGTDVAGGTHTIAELTGGEDVDYMDVEIA